MENRDVDKIGFSTKELAEEELRRIIETNYNVCKKVKPCRVYYSSITELYHLTSKATIVEYKK
jgi:hypothetical protein